MLVMMHIAIDSVNVISVEILIFLQWNKMTCQNEVAKEITYSNIVFSGTQTFAIHCNSDISFS